LEAREIERITREQYQFDLCFSMQKYRITASLFDLVVSCRPDTLPDSLVLRIIQAKRFSSNATKYGIDNEKFAIHAYKDYQQNHGRLDLLVDFLLMQSFLSLEQCQMEVCMIPMK